jgi:uncharacterized protein (TIGR03118 family)
MKLNPEPNHRSPAAIALTAVVSAALLATACGGGDDADFDDARALPTGVQNDAADNADEGTLVQARAAFAATDHAVRQRELPSLYGSSNPAAQAFALAATPAVGALASNEPKGRFPGVKQLNLVASTGAYGAPIVEPLLKNAWGIAIRPAGFGGHFWLGAAGTGQSIQYVGDVGGQPLFQDELKLVETGGPVSGVAFNGGSGFGITQAHANGPITAPTKFFFANLSGTITAWTERKRADGGFDHPADAVVVVDGSARGSSFAGVAVAPNGERLYAADFGADAQLRAFDAAFKEQAALPNPFRPASGKQPGGFEAFNVQTLDGSVFVTYGRQVAPDPTRPPPAEGRVVEFDANGKVVARWFGRGFLNYPWGVAIAPKSYGLYAGCLIVGNFGDGTLVAFHPKLRVALDYVRDADGNKVVIDGLWGLQFGNGASLGEAGHMYFAAGPEKETQGLFGKLQPNPNTLPVLSGLSMCR